MKCFGEVEYHEDIGALGTWRVKAEPHVMIRLKATLGRVNKDQFGQVLLSHSTALCRELHWFLQRFPMRIDEPSQRVLEMETQRYLDNLEKLERIENPDYTPRRFDLAYPARDYQARAVEIYLTKQSLLVGDQLGLGKSVTAIASLTDHRTLPALVVCGVHLQTQWQEYLAKFLPEATSHIIKQTKAYAYPKTDVLIISYSKLSAWAEILKGYIKSMIFDEVQELRHAGTGKYEAARAIRLEANYAMGLSATPIYNYGGEIYNILEILTPGQIGTQEEFEREWCISRGRHMLLRDPDAFGTYMRREFLMVRRTRKDVALELPPITTTVHTVAHDKKCLEKIEGMATELARRILEGKFEEQGMAAREFDARLRQATGIAKAPHVATFVRMLVESGEQVLLCGWHREVYAVWESMLSGGQKDEDGGELEEIKVVYYTGSESTAEKDEARRKFLDGEAPVMFMSLRSGVGLDGLQEVCSTIVHGELDWSPGVHEQCRGRLFRDGQKNCINELYLVSDGGSDPAVSEALGLKRQQVTGLLEPGGGGLKRLQSDGGARVKEMAREYLRRKGL